MVPPRPCPSPRLLFTRWYTNMRWWNSAFEQARKAGALSLAKDDKKLRKKAWLDLHRLVTCRVVVWSRLPRATIPLDKPHTCQSLGFFGGLVPCESYLLGLFEDFEGSGVLKSLRCGQCGPAKTVPST